MGTSISITYRGGHDARPGITLATLLAEWFVVALVAAAQPSPQATAVPPEDLRVQERVEVPRVLIDARVVDPRGSPIEGLSNDDFRLFVDGVPARLESVEWVSGAEPYAD